MKQKKRYATLVVILSLIVFLLSIPTAYSKSESSLNATQINSIAMLNYLAVLTQEINSSRNSRLYLENAYSSLINNIYPNAIDERTLEYLSGILDMLESYRMTTVKRERLQFVYEQNKAQLLRSIVPNPINILSIVQSKSKGMIALSIASAAFDVFSNYMSQSSALSLQHLREGWDLEDEEAATLHSSRKEAFNYMIRIVSEYSLPGDLALNENSVQEFVAAKNNNNLVQRIHFLEANQSTYQAMGEYWLVMLESYYRQGEYAKCLAALEKYENNTSRIFRKDYNLAKVLPFAILAAEQSMSNEDYLAFVEKYSKVIVDNVDNNEWALKYFVAQTLTELSTLTGNQFYLQQAFDYTLDNVNNMVSVQKDLNSAYMADVKTTVIPKDASKNVKDQIDKYNKQLKEERETALAPIYEPLLLNADLMFMLAKELNVTEDVKIKIDNILHQKGDNIFLNSDVDALFRILKGVEHKPNNLTEVHFNGKELTLPVDLVPNGYRIKVSITDNDNDKPSIYEDWVVSKVERKNKSDFASFTTVLISESIKQHKYMEGAEVLIEIVAADKLSIPIRSFRFTTIITKKDWWEIVKIWEDDVIFERLID